MSQRLTRQQIKRDEVGEALKRTMAFLSGHLRLVAVAIGVLVVLFLLGTAIDRMLGGRRSAASDKLAEAIQTVGAPLAGESLPEGADLPTFATAEERTATAKGQFEELVETYGRSKTAAVARSYLASIALEEGDLETARSLWAELAGGGDTVLAVQAELSLITLDRAGGRGEEVESRLSAQVDGSGVLPADVALYELAVTQEMLGKKDESVATYQQLLDEHPRSPHAAEARRKTAGAVGAGA